MKQGTVQRDQGDGCGGMVGKAILGGPGIKANVNYRKGWGRAGEGSTEGSQAKLRVVEGQRGTVGRGEESMIRQQCGEEILIMK